MAIQAYLRIHNALREEILDGRPGPGRKMPPERELCERFDVSRITVRHAMRLLQEQGLVERQAGRGTFVRRSRPKKLPILNIDYTGSMRTQAPDVERRLLNRREVVPPRHISEALGLLRSERCLLAERLDLLAGEPLAYDRAYIPLEYADTIDDAMLVRVSFLQIWLERQGLDASHMVESIEAAEAAPECVERLRVQIGCPMLLTTDVVYGANGAALAVFESVYRGDRFKLVSTSNDIPGRAQKTALAVERRDDNADGVRE
jgi:GntR family transcriptional regulator